MNATLTLTQALKKIEELERTNKNLIREVVESREDARTAWKKASDLMTVVNNLDTRLHKLQVAREYAK